MFGYLEELYELAGCKSGDLTDKYKILLLGGAVAYISNYKRILSYNTDLIVIKVQDNEINVQGSNLCIVSLDGGELIVKGNINSIFMSKVMGDEK